MSGTAKALAQPPFAAMRYSCINGYLSKKDVYNDMALMLETAFRRGKSAAFA